MRGGRSLPDEAIFSNVAENRLAPAGLALTNETITKEAMLKGV